MTKEELQIKILLESIAMLYGDLSELKSLLILETEKNKELELKIKAEEE